jgi:hypothetical protein
METKRLRPVLFKVWIPEQYTCSTSITLELGKPYDPDFKHEKEIIENTGRWSGFDRRGYFHGWGLGLTIDSLEGNYKINERCITVAIVEDRNGNIIECKPEHIKFTDV